MVQDHEHLVVRGSDGEIPCQYITWLTVWNNYNGNAFESIGNVLKPEYYLQEDSKTSNEY